MGDYTASGTKIGTCGNAYYATLAMIKANQSDPQCRNYANPKNGCTFAFPFPQWDDKQIGDITAFHADERIDFFFSFEAGKGHHKHMTFHAHPKGGHGVNVFAPCPQDRDAPKGSCSTNLPLNFDVYRLSGQAFFEGNLCIVGTCIYCGNENIFDQDEAKAISAWIRAQSHSKYHTERRAYVPDTEKAAYWAEIANRIDATYQQ